MADPKTWSPEQYQRALELADNPNATSEQLGRIVAGINAYRDTHDIGEDEHGEEVLPGLGTTSGTPPKVGSAPAETGTGVPAAKESASDVAQRELDKEAADERNRPKPVEPPGVPEAIGRGARKGLYFGWDDNAIGAATDFAATPLGGALARHIPFMDLQPGPEIQRTTRGMHGRNQAEEDAVAPVLPTAGETAAAGERAAYAAADEAHPWATGASRFGGSVLGTLPIAMGGAALLPEAAPVLSRMAVGALEGGGLGAAAGAGEDDANHLRGAAYGGAGGGALGMAIPGLMGTPWGKAASEKVGGALEQLASRKRAVSTGMGAGDAEEILRRNGSEGLEQFGRDVEKTGLHEDGFLPKSPKGYLKASERAKQTARTELDDISKTAPFQVDLSDTALDLTAEATRLKRLGIPEAQSVAEDLERRAAGIFQNTERNYSDALEFRQFLDKLAFKAGKQKDTILADNIRNISGKVKGAMLDAAEASDEAYAQGAAKFQDPLGPEHIPFKKRIEDVNKIYETASKTEDFSRGAYAASETAPVTTMDVVIPGTRQVVKSTNKRGAAAVSRAARTAQRAVEKSPDYLPAYAGMPWTTVQADESNYQ